MTDMYLHNFGTPGRGKTVLLPSSGSWLQDAQEQTRMRRRAKEQAEEYREEMERRRQKREAERAEIKRRMEDDETVKIPAMLLDALLDHYHYDYWAIPDRSHKIVSAYLDEEPL